MLSEKFCASLSIISIIFSEKFNEIPEKIFFDSGQELSREINRLEGTIVNSHFFGSHTRYQIKLADGSCLKLSIHHRKTIKNKYANGESVRVLFAVSDVFQINEK